MLRDSRDLGVLGLDARAKDAREADLAGVAFQGAEDEGVDLALDVSGGFSVGERLVGGGLLQAIWVGDLAEALRGGGVSEEAKDRVDDSVGVVEVQGRADRRQVLFVGVLCKAKGSVNRGSVER